VCPLLGIAMFACATEENDFPSPSLTTGEASGGVSAGTGGGSGGTSVVGSSGTFGTSGTGASGASTGGSPGISGASAFGGTFSTPGGAGSSTGGKANGGAGTAGGAGGKASGGTGGASGNSGSAGAGGKASGGTGGKASAGSGGGGNTQCGGTIPATSTWKALAQPEAEPAANAFDGNIATRFTTGQPQNGGEWLEINFGARVTFTQITMSTPNDDYPRHYQLLLSNTSKDSKAVMLKEDDGKTGTITVTLLQARTGQFLTIRQTGKVVMSWWSVHEVSIACE